MLTNVSLLNVFNILAMAKAVTISPAVCVSLFSIHDVQKPRFSPDNEKGRLSRNKIRYKT